MKKISELLGDSIFPWLNILFRIMKLTTFLILISVVCVFATESYSQSKLLNLNMEKATVKEVLSYIEDQSEFNFMYSGKLIDVNREVTINVQNAKIEEVLKSLFAGTEIGYTLNNRIIILTKPEFNVGFTNQQQKSISGKVTDTSGGSLPGVSIVVKGTTNGTITDTDGNYSISNIPANGTLKYSFVGMKISEIPIGNKTVINVVLEEETIGLEEVVAVGYGTQSRRTVTSSVSKFEGDKLESMPINSIGDGLKGKVSGLRMYSTDFQPGENPTFRIRGGSSINKSNEPVTVVDGVVRDIAGINPNDIQSIEVLKDAASAAIYGAKASNGIILITTKKGSVTKGPSILFEASGAYQEPAQGFDLMSAEDYLTYMRPAIARGKYPARNFSNGYSASSANTESSMWTTRYLGDGEAVPAGWKSMIDPIDNTKTLIFEDNDFQERFFRPSVWQNYYIGANGGDEKVKYAASIGYTDDGGIGIGTGFSRFTMRGNTDFKINEKLSFATGFDYSQVDMEDYDDNKRNILHRGLSTPFTHRINNATTGLPEKGYNGSTPAPDWYEYYYDRGRTTKRSTVFGQLTYRINDNWKMVAMATNFNRHTRSHSFIKANEYNGLRDTDEGYSETQRLDLQAYANYNKRFNEVHNVSATIGTDYMKDKLNSFNASVTGASSDKVPTLSAGSTPGNPTSSVTDELLISYFGRFNYDYSGKYLFSATVRADGSSKFGTDTRWGYFPAVSAGWIMTEEDFMSGIGALNNLKIRASYGQTGNNSIGLFDSYGSYSTSGKYGGNSTIVTSTIPNQNLKWETTNQLDAGFDAGFLKDKIKFSFDYFNKTTNNLIFSNPLPNTSGYNSIITNIGKVRFYGVDFELTTQNIKTKNFSWTTDFTYSYVMNRVLELPDNGRDKNRIGGITLGDGSTFGGTAEGESMYSIYGYKVDRILETESEAYAALYDANSNGFRFSDGKTIKGRKDVGDYEWVNRPGSTQRNGEDQITSEDQFLLGYTIPHTTGGFGNTFAYKNVSLYVFMDYQLGHTVQNYLQERYFMGTFNYNYNLTNEVKKAWTKPGDNTKYAKFFANDADDGNKNYSRVSDTFSEKGDFLCIREVTLSYKVPVQQIKKLGMQNVSIYVSGNNLYYFTAVTGVPPENGTGSTYDTDYSPYPAARKYAAGVKVTF